jgi:hypothetical protein
MNLISSDQIPKLNISTRKNVFKCQKSAFYVGGLNKVHKNYEKTVCGNFPKPLYLFSCMSTYFLTAVWKIINCFYKKSGRITCEFSGIYFVSVFQSMEGSSEYRFWTTDEIYNTRLWHRFVSFGTQFNNNFIFAKKSQLKFGCYRGIQKIEEQ